MLMIKLAKIGKTNKKVFRLIISEKGRDPYGRALEILGSYNPYSKELQAKSERINYWIEKGAGMTSSVNNLLVGKDIVKGDKVKASKAGKKNEKREAQLKAKADKKAATEAAATPPAEEKKEETEEKLEENAPVEEKAAEEAKEVEKEEKAENTEEKKEEA